jgi:hypothetical protein
MSKFHFCMCNFKKFIYIIFLDIYIYIYIYKRVLRVLFSGSKFHVSDTHISVSFVSRVIVSSHLVSALSIGLVNKT